METTNAVRSIAKIAPDGLIFAPQCGLAPGFIGILAHHLASGFEQIDEVKMRVGALPQYPSNMMMYNLTWSTKGVIVSLLSLEKYYSSIFSTIANFEFAPKFVNL